MKLRTWLRTNWDWLGGAVCVLTGAVLIILGYVGMMNSRYVVQEISYLISGGVAGLLALGIGTVLFIMADVRHGIDKLRQVEAGVLEREIVPSATRDEIRRPSQDDRAFSCRA